MYLERKYVTSQLQIPPVLSGSNNNSEHSVHVFMKRLKSDLCFQTEVEEGKMEDSYGRFKMLDISNRFKMLDISNRFEIWDFKCILNVEM